jgi:hypothetical protein
MVGFQTPRARIFRVELEVLLDAPERTAVRA